MIVAHVDVFKEQNGSSAKCGLRNSNDLDPSVLDVGDAVLAGGKGSAHRRWDHGEFSRIAPISLLAGIRGARVSQRDKGRSFSCRIRRVRGSVAALGVGVWLAAAAVLAAEPDRGAAAPVAGKGPRDGHVAFVYAREDGVTGCTQPDEAAMRFLVEGVMRVDPFVPAGDEAPVTLDVHVARRGAAVRATFALRDAAGAPMGSSYVEDATCDGAHLKLVASIALALIPATVVKPAAAAAATSAAAAETTAAEAAATKRTGESSPSGQAAGAPGGGEPAEAAGTRGMAAGHRATVCKSLLVGYCSPVDIYSVSLALGGVMSLNFTADPGAGAWLNAELRPVEAVSLGLEFRGLFPSRVVADIPVDPSKPSGSPKEPMISNLEAMLVPCFRYSWLMACGVLHFGFSIAQTPARLSGWPIAGAGPRLGIEIPFADRFFVRAQGDLLFNFTETGFVLLDQNLKWEQRIVSGFIGAGVGATFN